MQQGVCTASMTKFNSLCHMYKNQEVCETDSYILCSGEIQQLCNKTFKNFYYGPFLTWRMYWGYHIVVFSLKKHKVPRDFSASFIK
jgi:hypothetical protein